jgi:hypothetical protein
MKGCQLLGVESISKKNALKISVIAEAFLLTAATLILPTLVARTERKKCRDSRGIIFVLHKA